MNVQDVSTDFRKLFPKISLDFFTTALIRFLIRFFNLCWRLICNNMPLSRRQQLYTVLRNYKPCALELQN